MKCESAFEICAFNSNAVGLNGTSALQPQHTRALWGCGALEVQGKSDNSTEFFYFHVCNTLMLSKCSPSNSSELSEEALRSL